jgi:hypothetical protein
MNKITLIGQNKENGYGIVEERGDVFLIKQPFDVGNKILLKGEEVDEAFSYRFDSIDFKEFSDYLSLEKYLNDLFVSAKQEAGIEEKKVDLSTYYKTLPTELIQLNIDFLEDYLEDYSFINFVHQSLEANPNINSIAVASKKKLENFLRQAEEVQERRMLAKKKSVFPNVDMGEWWIRYEFKLGLAQVNTKSIAA